MVANPSSASRGQIPFGSELWAVEEDTAVVLPGTMMQPIIVDRP